MISAKLIKRLEQEGFALNFPSYESIKEIIIEILKEKNERLFLAIPLLLQQNFSYEQIKNKLNKKPELIKSFNKIILITKKIFELENMENNEIKRIISQNKIKGKITPEEFNYYYNTFKDSTKKKENKWEEILKEQIKIRGTLNTNKSLSIIFSPAKIRIMNQIFNHEKLTNTELKYYYRSIRPLINSILNENMQKYLRIVESSKKTTSRF